MPNQQATQSGLGSLDQDAVRLAKSIRKIESNDNFQARGKSREYGAYQYTPETWAARSRKYGINVPLQQATPEQQNEVQYKWIKEKKDQGYDIGQIASMHNAGEGRPNAHKEGFKGVNQFGVQYDVPAYANKVASEYQRLKGSQSNGSVSIGGDYPTPPHVEPFTAYKPTEETQEQKPTGLVSRIGRGVAKFATTMQKPFIDIGAIPTQALAKAAGLPDPFAGAEVPTLTGGVEANPLELKRKLGSAAQIGAYAIPGATIPRLALSGALAGGGYQAAEGGANRDIAIGAGLGGIAGGALGLAAKVTSNAPKLLSYTSDVPEEAFNTMLARRPQTLQAIKEGITDEKALGVAQGAVKNLRAQLSKDWDEGVRVVIDQNTGSRINLGVLSKKLTQISDDFGVDLPQNIHNVSANEAIDLITKINSLPEKMLTFAPKGAIVREVKKELINKAKSSFGDSFKTLYKNYSDKSTVLNAADDIVKAYKTGKPITQTTAMNRLMSVFNSNKAAYLDAIIDLERVTGIDILSKVAGVKFSPKMPGGMTPISATSGLMAPASTLEKALDLLLIPFTSPRSAGAISRGAELLKPGVELGAEAVTKSGLVPRALQPPQ